MSRILFASAFLLGAVVVAWMGLAFIGTDLLGLTVTVVIAVVYSIGFIEILRFREATLTLSNALSVQATEAVTELGPWLAKLHPSLQNSVRLRIEGERVGLPAPVITPYLVGLLVMLGLLGTFLGMVDTLQGAVAALEGTTELQAIRAGLAAPIKGLGLAFGTSVAGVAASAMLGLISTISRRDRMSATRLLDSKIASVFREFSLIYNRLQTFKAMQVQANALPEVADRLQSLASSIERMGENLGEQLIANQQQFHQSVGAQYSELASSVDQSLRDSVAESGRQAIESGRLASESIKPLLQELMRDIRNETEKTHQQLSQTAQQQLEGVTGSLVDSFETRSSSWIERQQSGDQERLELWTRSFEQAGEQSLKQHQAAAESLQQTAGEMAASTRAASTTMVGEISELLKSSEALVETRVEAEASWLQGHNDRMTELTTVLKTELEALRNDEERRGEAAVASLAGLESTVASQLATLGKELEEPMTRLIQTASETPRAAAEVIDHLRREISNNIERDNSLLEERQRIMTELDTLSASLQQATSGQREAVESLLTASADMLKDVGSQFSGHVDSEVTKLSAIADNLGANANQIADNFAGSAIEMSSLGEAFTLAVTLFNESNGSLIESLNRIEQSLDQSTTRSDEQLAYYVAQAREIIDHSMLSQKEIFDELRQLSPRGETASTQALEEAS